MPTYEYIREDGTRFDIIQKFSDTPLTECPETGLPVKRIISGGSGVIYKGSGWYVTDYKNNVGNKEKASAESDTVSKPDTTTTTPAKTEKSNTTATDKTQST